MAKASLQNTLNSVDTAKQEAIALAKEHIEAAALALSTFGPELERVAWLLEDTLVYIDQACEKATSAPLEKSDKFMDELEKLVNAGDN